MYIYQHKKWPEFTWDDEQLITVLGALRNIQGRLLGKMEALGFHLRKEAMLETLTLDVLKSTEIEGEILHPEQVRSSIARRLGIEIAGLIASDRNVDGVVEMMLDATQRYSEPLSKDRLFGWHAALFPAGRSGVYKITVGNWRKDETAPMQVVSGAMGKEKVYYQAPGEALLEKEMTHFIKWFNSKDGLDPVLKAGIAHLWFVTIHPFDDGNGRIARAIADLQLARADRNNQRFYSMSARIRVERKAYYDILERTQKGGLDITAWLLWFLKCLSSAVNITEHTFEGVMQKARFWERHAVTILNKRQRLLVNKLLDGFTGNLNSSKWAKIAKCSFDTALRDIQDLVNKEVLTKTQAGGRSTSYELVKY